MVRDKEIVERKPMSLVQARKRLDEHKVTSRIEGKKQGQRKPDERKGKH